jgi:IS4 transposase
LALSRYLLVLTNLEPDVWTGLQVLELYRCRWQIELAFKRLKGLLKLCYDARFFSLWGY